MSIPPPERRVYCNRTLNLRSLRAIGYDMDYTLVQYRVEEWERRAYEHLKRRLAAVFPVVERLVFRTGVFVRGLIVDRELGNIVKANRFGYVKRAYHGTHLLDFEVQRRIYGRTIVDTDDKRFVSLDTPFSQSESSMYADLVDMLDEGLLPRGIGYAELFDKVHESLDRAHIEGELKAEIMADPEKYVEPDPELAQTLLDQRAAGRKLLLITNSDWPYTRTMMSFVLDRFLDQGSWKDLFHLIIVSACKPEFFSSVRPIYEVVSDDGLLRPWNKELLGGKVYAGGDAGKVEAHLSASGEEILYVGDHMLSDVHASKSVLRWRTALVIQELEDEIKAIQSFRPIEIKLEALMIEKEKVEAELAQAMTIRARSGKMSEDLKSQIEKAREKIAKLDAEIMPLAKASSELGNSYWGPLMRAGNDKSLFARHVERSADLYTSRVSNFLYITPYAYLRAPRGSMPHDLSVTTEVSDTSDLGQIE